MDEKTKLRYLGEALALIAEKGIDEFVCETEDIAAKLAACRMALAIYSDNFNECGGTKNAAHEVCGHVVGGINEQRGNLLDKKYGYIRITKLYNKRARLKEGCVYRGLVLENIGTNKAIPADSKLYVIIRLEEAPLVHHYLHDRNATWEIISKEEYERAKSNEAYERQ